MPRWRPSPGGRCRRCASALLATRGTLAAAFYGKRLAQHGFEWIAPTEDEQARLVDRAIERVKAGDLASARTAFEGAAAALAKRGVDLILIACTELPLAAAGAHSPVPLLDASRALAEAIVAWSLGFATAGRRDVS